MLVPFLFLFFFLCPWLVNHPNRFFCLCFGFPFNFVFRVGTDIRTTTIKFFSFVLFSFEFVAKIKRNYEL